MFLFLLSFVMVMVSSYLLASVFTSKRYMTWLMYYLLIAFAQVVLTIEILSLFSAISKVGILALNVVFASLIAYYWKKKQCPVYKPQFKEFWLKVFKAIKKDKMLGVIGLGFLCFIGVTLVLCVLVPVTAYDGLSYHITRALAWASQGNLNHFDIADDRNLVMAINSEILYTWFFTFVPRNMFLSFFSFAGYVLTMCSLYSLLEISGYCMRKRLWVIFLTSSIAGVLVEASSVETNIIISGLALASVALFLQGVKTDKFVPVFFSALSLALAVGTKTPIFFMIPGIALLFVLFLLNYRKEAFWRYTGFFTVSFAVSIVLFAIYNYVLNFIDYGHFGGSLEAQYYHGMKGGLKGYVSGVIHHLVLLLDFSGFTYGTMIQKYVFLFQDSLLTALNIPLDLNIISTNDNKLNWTLMDTCIGGGVISVIVLLPCVFIAMLRGIFCKKYYKNRLLALFGVSLFVSILVMSGIIGFMLFSSRFIVSFLTFCAPVFVLSYIKSNKNFFKYIILCYLMTYFLVISTHISGRHFMNVYKELKSGATLRDVRNLHLCSKFIGFSGKMPYCDIRNTLYKIAPVGSKIGLFSSSSRNTAVIKFMEADGYKVDFMLAANYNNYNLSEYDYLVFDDYRIQATNLKNSDWAVDGIYKEGNKIKFREYNDKPCCLFLAADTEKDSNIIDRSNVDRQVKHSVMCYVPEILLEKDGFVKVARVVARNGDTDKDVESSIYQNQRRASKELQ